MPFTPEEEQDIRKRILDLEAEKTKLTERLDGAANKAELRTELDLVKKDLSEARRELAELKKAPKPPLRTNGPAEEDEDSLDFLDVVGGEGGDHE